MTTQDVSEAPGAFDGPRQARSPTSDIFGKLDAALPEVRINSDALEIIRRKAVDNQMCLSEWIRIRLYVDAMGLDHVISINEQRIRRATGNAVQTKRAGVESAVPSFLQAEQR